MSHIHQFLSSSPPWTDHSSIPHDITVNTFTVISPKQDHGLFNITLTTETCVYVVHSQLESYTINIHIPYISPFQEPWYTLMVVMVKPYEKDAGRDSSKLHFLLPGKWLDKGSPQGFWKTGGLGRSLGRSLGLKVGSSLQVDLPYIWQWMTHL